MEVITDFKILLFWEHILLKTPKWPTPKIQPLNHHFIHKCITWSSILTIILPTQIKVLMGFKHFQIKNLLT